MTNEATILMRLDSDLQRPFRSDLTTDNLNLHNEVTVKLRDRVEAFKKKKEPLLADRTKSDQGIAEAIAASTTSALGDYTFLKVVADRWAETVARLRRDLMTIKTPPDMDKQDARGILAEYASLSQQEKDVVFLKAAEASSVEDPEHPDAQQQATDVLWAFLSKRGAPMVTEDVQRRALEERAKQMQPAVYAQLEQAEIMAEQLGGLRDHVVVWLRGLGADQKTVFEAMGGPVPDSTVHHVLVHQG